jgi:type VI secretion system FHA domain protein
MPFSVKITNRDSSPTSAATVRTVARPRITIGRASNCDVVLDDPKRHVSRVHALVAERDGGYVLSVVSKINYVLVNGQMQRPNTSVAIKPGDHIELGRYVLEVLTGDVKVSHAQTVALEPEALRAVPARDAARPASREAAPAPASPRAGAGRRAKGLIESLAQEAEVEAAQDAQAAAGPASREAPVAEAGRGAAALTEARAALVRAFIEGAGIGRINPSEIDAEAFFRDCGALVRASIEGIVGLLMARSEMKKEIHAEDRTMISSRDNNPLRLMSDPQEALSYIFDPQATAGAFLPPVDSVRDACEELRTHEIALMAAMRAAIMGAIERFNPARLEKELTKARSGITLNRKAALWDVFVAYQAKLARDTEDDFNRVFAREFLGTYTEQVQRLHEKR